MNVFDPNTPATSELEWQTPRRSTLVQVAPVPVASATDLAARVDDAVDLLRTGQDLPAGSSSVLVHSGVSDAPYVSDSLAERSGRLTDPSAYVFLDVDGIINPYLDRLNLDGWYVYNVGQYQVWYSDALSLWLNNLLDNNIQIVWATTWVNNPSNLADLAEMWGLPSDLPAIFGLQFDDLDERRFDCGKRTGVDRWLTENNVDPSVTPVAWVDDMIGKGDIAFAQARGITPIVVEPKRGLSNPTYTDAIEAVVLS